MSRRVPASACARLTGALLLAAMAAGCGSTRPRGPSGPIALRSPLVVAVLPFEDLSGRTDVSLAFTRVFHAELARSGIADVLDPGVVDGAVERLQVRSTAAMSGSEMKSLADSLNVTHFLFGNVLEAGNVHTVDGDLPAVAATLRLVEADSAKVVWACHHSLTGEDHETIFGWGREKSRERLLGRLAVDMIDELRTSVKRNQEARRTP